MRCIAPKLIWPHRSVEWSDKNEEYAVSVPCGKCLACLSNKRQEWIFRLEQEFKYSKNAMFVTLTYDPKHYPGQLQKRDLQLFMKRLRKKDGSNSIRYYAVGEYGTNYGRAHYHILLFNGTEEHVRQAWRDAEQKPIGVVHIGKVTQASIAYCTKYIIQQSGNEQPDGREKPFSLMSRGYGIGGRYLTDNMVRWHRENMANYSVNAGFKVRLSRFYKSKIWYKEDEREALSKVALLKGLTEQVRVRQWFEDRYGEKGDAKYMEMRDAMLARIKSKVAYSQTF